MDTDKLKENDVVQLTLKLMESTELTNRTGSEKKKYVMNSVKYIIGDELYHTYSDIISTLIDVMVLVSKGDLKLKLNNMKRKYCCF
jgi:hypothetical protein